MLTEGGPSIPVPLSFTTPPPLLNALTRAQTIGARKPLNAMVSEDTKVKAAVVQPKAPEERVTAGERPKPKLTENTKVAGTPRGTRLCENTKVIGEKSKPKITEETKTIGQRPKPKINEDTKVRAAVKPSTALKAQGEDAKTIVRAHPLPPDAHVPPPWAAPGAGALLSCAHVRCQLLPQPADGASPFAHLFASDVL